MAEIKDPQIYVSKDARKVYDYMRDEIDELRNFKPENKDLLFLAIALGFKDGRTKPIDQKEREPSGFTRERYLSPTENGILRAIAITESKKIDVIGDSQYIFSLAQDFANRGIDYLKEIVMDNPAGFTKKLASELKKHLKETS